MGRSRLHKSTIVVALLASVALTLIVAPGNQTVMHPGTPARFDHGWPWMFLQRDVYWGSQWWNQAKRDAYPVQEIGDIPWLSLTTWKFWQGDAGDFSALNLALDVAIAFIIVGGLTGAWEWRRRRRASVWQFRLSEMFAATTLLAAWAGWFAWQHREHSRELPHAEALESLVGVYVLDSCVAPQWVQRLVGREILPGYLWRAEEVLASIHDDAPNGDFQSMLHHLQQLQRLHTVELDAWDINTQAVFAALAKVQKVRTLDVTTCDDLTIGFEEAVELAKLQHLTRLVVYDRSNLTNEARDVIRQEMPRCQVEYYEDNLGVK